MPSSLDVAYVSMEIGLTGRMPTFAGGLGLLAADLMRSSADLGLRTACITLLWKNGYPQQTLKGDGSIHHEERHWDPAAEGLTLLRERASVQIEGRSVHVCAWLLNLRGAKTTIPVYFLDTDLPENAAEDREITRTLYGGGQEARMKQEIILGIGGIRMLRALGHTEIGSYHMNEGHCAFLTLELLKERGFSDDAVRASCAFTTHTPVPAGHDVFPYDLAQKLLGDMLPWHIKRLAGEDALSMTLLAMRLSRYTCGVSKIHGAVARAMLHSNDIDSITNGIHHPTWASVEMQQLFDAHLPGWREHPEILAHAHALPDADILEAHTTAKKRLIDEIKKRTGRVLDPKKLLIVEARRIVPYKQPELLYANEERLMSVGGGRIEIVHSGNSHSGDTFAAEVIQHLHGRGERFGNGLPVVYVPQYDPEFAALLVAGADIWLNTPMRLKEASGTSGMKAALNGTLNLSTLDGWWAEAYAADPEAGWRVGPERDVADEDTMRKLDAEDILTQLQNEILPEYESDPARWAERMKRSIALVATFNTHRCIAEYSQRAWNIKA